MLYADRDQGNTDTGQIGRKSLRGKELEKVDMLCDIGLLGGRLIVGRPPTAEHGRGVRAKGFPTPPYPSAPRGYPAPIGLVILLRCLPHIFQP